MAPLSHPDLAPLAALPGGVTSTVDIAHVTKVNVARGVDVVKTRANPRAGSAKLRWALRASPA